MGSDDPEEQLVLAAQGGDRVALEALLRQEYQRLYAVCRRLTGNDADGADATQEALMALVRGLPHFRSGSRFSTWAYRVAVNASLDELRRRRRRPQPAPDELLPADSANAGPEDVATRIDVEAALRRLPGDYRAAVVLRDLCGLDYAEIGEVLGIPPGTVRSRIARGRAGLVPLLGGNPEPSSDRPTAEP